MGHFSFSNIGKPTKKQLRMLSKALIAISQPSAALALFSNTKYGGLVSVIIGSAGIIGAALAEMYSPEEKPNEQK